MDYYTALRRETVKSARFDPLIFLYAHLGDEGAFDGHVFSPNLRGVPVLMRLVNDDHISLSITEWYDEISVFDCPPPTSFSLKFAASTGTKLAPSGPTSTTTTSLATRATVRALLSIVKVGAETL